ncbi:MAG: hypothetical protein GW854_01645 [Erythrobacter sp.]|nr:hypothetical protein [Erythrobacter sp.]
MDEWDDLVATGFELLADPAIYVIAGTGERRPVGVIPIDEAETWQARRGEMQATGSKVIARLFVEQMPEGWRGPDVTEADRLEHKGATWKVKPVRDELNGVWVVELGATRKR